MKEAHLQKTKINRRYLWSFFTVVIIVDALITLSLFTIYSQVQIHKARESSIAQLEQVGTSTDILYESLVEISKQVAADTDIYLNLLSNKVNRLREIKACNKLKAIKTTNPYLRYITIYNATTQRAISNTYAEDCDDNWADPFFDRISEKRKYGCFVRKVGANYTTQSPEKVDVYTFVFPIKIKADGSTDLVILDINESYFDKVINNLWISGQDQEIILLEDDLSIISNMFSDKSSERFYRASKSSSLQTPIKTYLQKADDESSGSFSFRQNGVKQFVTFTRSNVSAWVIAHIIPYHSILSGLLPIALLTIALSLVTLGFGYIISKKFSASLYAPIKVLYENYVSAEASEKKENELELLSRAFSEMYRKADQFEQGLISSYNESKNFYLRQLLYGEESKVETARPQFERLEIDLTCPNYGIILIECISQSDRPDCTDADLFISYYALENVAREVIAKHTQLDFVRMEENLFAALLYFHHDFPQENLAKDLKTICKVMIEEFSIETTICIGQVAKTWHNINLCYEQATISLSSRAYRHHGSVFFAIEKPEQMQTSHYFLGLHNKFTEYIREGKSIEACAKEFDQAIVSMENISFKAAKSYFSHVMMSVLDNFAVFFGKENERFSTILNHVSAIDQCQNVKSLKKVVIEALSDIMRQYQLTKQSSAPPSALQVKEYIDQNYANPDITLNMLADIVNLSPAYLGKTFSASVNCSFNDYLNHVRLEKAAELLKTSKLSVEEVSKRTGILNTNYFYSLFKKKYGMTPSMYRKTVGE